VNRPNRPAARSGSRRSPPGEVRLIGGLWKRSKLPVPDRPGLRPTPDRVKETLFNWLGQDLGGWRVLDAFAGTGALGFEAASRGAAEVVLLERDPVLAHSLEATRQRLGGTMVRIERADALAWMASAAPGRFELVLLDPPFDAGLALPAMAVAVRSSAASMIAPPGTSPSPRRVISARSTTVRHLPPTSRSPMWNLMELVPASITA